MDAAFRRYGQNNPDDAYATVHIWDRRKSFLSRFSGRPGLPLNRGGIQRIPLNPADILMIFNPEVCKTIHGDLAAYWKLSKHSERDSFGKGILPPRARVTANLIQVLVSSFVPF